MSYARWSDHSDIYCYEHADGGYVTHVTDGCYIVNSTKQGCIATLQNLASAGLKVPDHTITDLENEIMEDKHQLFYKAYHALREQFPALHFQLDGSSVDELDSLIWSALGYPEPYHLSNTRDLTEWDCSRLRLLSGEHGLTLFKIMLVKREVGNRAYWEK